MEKTRKLLALSLSLLIMLSIFTAVNSTSAFAADSYNITAKSSQSLFSDISDNYKAEDEFDLNVFIEADEPILSGTVNIKFDPSALFVTSAKKGSGVNGSFFAAGANSATYQNKNKLIAINFSCGLDAADFTTEALLFTAHFKVKSEIEANQSVIVDISTLDGIEDPYDINTEFPYIDNNTVVRSGITARAELTNNSAPSTTVAPTTEAPTTQAPTTQAPTTQAPTTQAPTTQAPTTQAPTTQAPTTQAPTTQAPTTQAPTTQAPTTQAPTTQAPTTQAPTTQAPTTQAPTTQAPTTQAPTTARPTTVTPTTAVPTTVNPGFYTFYFQPSLNQEENNCNYKLYFKDLNGSNPENTHRYTFTKTPIKQGDTYYYRVSVPKYYDDVAELQYQIYIGNTWISQISFDRVKLSDFDNIIIKNDDYEIVFPTEEPTTDALITAAFTTEAPATEVSTTAVPTTPPVTEATEPITTKAVETETTKEAATIAVETETKAEVTTEAVETETKAEVTTEAVETETHEEVTTHNPSTEATETTETEPLSTKQPASEPTETITTSEPEQTSSPSVDTKTFYYQPSKEQVEAGYIFKITIQDNKGNYYTYNLTATDDLLNSVNIYKAETDASSTITTIYYQVFDGDKWISHITVSPDIAEGNIIQYDGTVTAVEPDNTENTTAATLQTEAPTNTYEPTSEPSTQPEIKTKKPNPIKVSVKTKTIKAKKLRKKAQKIKAVTVKNAKGKVTYKLIKKGSKAKLFKKSKINSKGVIKIKKLKLKKGKYKLKVRITAKGNSLYKKKTITKTVKIKVK